MTDRYTPGMDSTSILVAQKQEALARLRKEQPKQPPNTQLAYVLGGDGTVTASYSARPPQRKYGRNER